MKNLIILALVAVAGYYAYRHFSAAPEGGPGERAGAAAPLYVPDIPADCEARGKTMGDAIYGYDIGRVSVAQLNHATRSFQSCLRTAGFSDAQINATYDRVREEVMGLNPGSARGY